MASIRTQRALLLAWCGLSCCPVGCGSAAFHQRSGGSVRSARQAATTGSVCERSALDSLDLPGLQVRAVVPVAAAAFTPPRASTPLADAPAFCRVSAVTTAAPETTVEFEVWVPNTWNGKIVTTGNGGYSNTLSYRDMANALRQGYATIGGDTGHQTATPDDLLWGASRRARIAEWGSHSIHSITVPGKRIVERLAGAAPKRAYFYGCSTGGHQAYAEMQRYPEDFDGVIAGAPGNNRVRLNAGFLWQFLANRRRGAEAEPILPAHKLPAITKAVVAACDGLDGVTDGVIDDPRSCTFDPASMLCASSDEPGCLTQPQIEAFERMSRGARNLRTGEQIYPGWPRGSEALTTLPDGRPSSGWHQYWGGAEPTRVNFWRYWLFNDPQWDWWSFDFDRHMSLADETLGSLIDQNSVVLDTFKRRGGKAVVFQGWQDPVVNALDTIAYVDRLRARQGATETDGFFRLFLVPGMGHCSGGTGATVFGNSGERPPVVDVDHDLLMALDAWVEQGLAPERVIAARVENGRTTRTRPLCAYPKRAVYAGIGSTDDAASFVCR